MEFKHLGRGAFAHESIMTAKPVEREHEIGLVAHYVIGSGLPSPSLPCGRAGSTSSPWCQP
ncbi:Protein of uncharacterised function (DUF2938) [Dermatophilus congolensis]|uniref:Protein of uncharacterized function (DUF2938) n=1 Tax=Dermatophilus congolensis TaxID=1863 RepID=A0AA46GZQ9_9MICO|nr:DUF2938 family protein [Dermatophilus congolensis]STD05534.1 Protein of uncharacterised function (DUF2938) [Dermatophilus congolensis]